MRASSVLAAISLLFLVPGAYVLAALGSSRLGLYPDILVPIVFAVVFVVASVTMFVVLSYLREREGDYAPARQ